MSGSVSAQPASSTSPPPPADIAALRDTALAATCAQCHGPAGRPPAGSNLPALAGRSAPELIEAMRAYRDGERPGTLMPQLARGYDAAQVERIAAWFAARPAAGRRETPR